MGCPGLFAPGTFGGLALFGSITAMGILLLYNTHITRLGKTVYCVVIEIITLDQPGGRHAPFI